MIPVLTEQEHASAYAFLRSHDCVFAEAGRTTGLHRTDSSSQGQTGVKPADATEP